MAFLAILGLSGLMPQSIKDEAPLQSLPYLKMARLCMRVEFHLVTALTIYLLITEPPVAGKNAQNPHPEYHKWRNSSFEQGVPENTPESAKQGLQFPPRPTTFSLPIRRQLDHISAKAQAQHLQPHPHPHPHPHPRPPIPSPTPAMGKLKYNIHAPPFTSAYRKYDDPAKSGQYYSSVATKSRSQALILWAALFERCKSKTSRP